jgi:hypothetical protein
MHMTLLVHVQMNGHSAVGAWPVAAANRRHRQAGRKVRGGPRNGERAPAQWGIMVAGTGRRI